MITGLIFIGCWGDTDCFWSEMSCTAPWEMRASLVLKKLHAILYHVGALSIYNGNNNKKKKCNVNWVVDTINYLKQTATCARNSLSDRVRNVCWQTGHLRSVVGLRSGASGGRCATGWLPLTMGPAVGWGAREKTRDNHNKHVSILGRFHCMRIRAWYYKRRGQGMQLPIRLSVCSWWDVKCY